jgi:hypothetical protein
MWRRVRPGRSSLVRTSDRVESWVLALMLVVVLLALPFSIALGAQTYAQQAHLSAVQHRDRAPATATLLVDAPAANTTSDPAQTRVTVPVRAEWSLDTGLHRTGVIDAHPGLDKGSTMTIWVGRDGDPVPPPLSSATAVWNAAAAAISAWLLVAGCCALVYWGVRRALDRARYRGWEREWARLQRQRHGL